MFAAESVWAWDIGFDVTLTLVLWSCIVILAAVVLVAALLAVIRVASLFRWRRQHQCERIWLPLLVQALEQMPQALPRIRRRDTRLLLSLWNRLHDAIKGTQNRSLNLLALQVGLDAAARRLFVRPSLGDKLLAIATLGRLGDRTLWNEFERLATRRDLELSLAATRAMVRIDPRCAMKTLLPIVAKRDDWPPSTVALILEEAGADVISEPLVEAVLRTHPADAHRLIRYLGLAHADATRPLLRRLIRQVSSVESIAACLRVFSDADDVDAIRPYLHHPRWEVRVRAIKALEKLGSPRDAASLAVLLSDFEWWVRYRAAQALCSLLAGELDPIRRLRAEHTDPFARDILTHVLAEQGAA